MHCHVLALRFNTTSNSADCSIIPYQGIIPGQIKMFKNAITINIPINVKKGTIYYYLLLYNKNVLA